MMKYFQMFFSIIPVSIFLSKTKITEFAYQQDFVQNVVELVNNLDGGCGLVGRIQLTDRIPQAVHLHHERSYERRVDFQEAV